MAVLRIFPEGRLMAGLRLAALAVMIGVYGLAGGAQQVEAAGLKLIVIVEDEPITEYDVSQRVALQSALGDAQGSSGTRRKEALDDLINDVVLEKEMVRRKANITEKQIHDWISNMAKSSNMTVDALKKALRAKGVNYKTLERQVAGALRTRWLLGQQNITVDVDDSAVDREYAKLTSDPRYDGVTVYEIREVSLPVEGASEAMAQQLMYARAVEAQQIAKRYSGCASLGQATSGIYNVKLGKTIEADGRKLPAQMRDALNSAGTKKLIGPMTSKGGIQMIAFCGKRTIKAEKPPKEAVRNMLMNKKYEEAADKALRELRQRAFVEYRDPSYKTN